MKRIPLLAIGMIVLGVVGLGVIGCIGSTPFIAAPSFGRGMMGNWGIGGYTLNATPLSLDQAVTRGEQYVASLGGDLELAEVMEFSNHFYGEVKEKSTDIHAFEFLMDKYSGAISPEPGPNMMWNTKYGHMGGGMMGGGMMGTWRWGSSSVTNRITPEQAKQFAQQYLDANLPGATVGEVAPFYGYYTLHVEREGKTIGMLSVNGFDGAVWYHTWHGRFIGMKELD